MSDLDVVSRLAAHQQHLTPVPPARDRVLLALPPPPIVSTLLGRARMRALRRARLTALAARLGGGSGPLRTVDLDTDPRPLPALLARLARSGVRELLLDGARDQPGFAREIACRAPCAIRRTDDPDEPFARLLADVPSDAAAWLHGDAHAPPLDPAIARVEPGDPILDGARVIMLALDGEADPAVETARLARDTKRPPEVDIRAFAVDRARLAGPWSGFVPPEALFGTPRGAAARARWNAYWTARSAPDAVRLAVLGLDPRLDATLHRSNPPPPPRRRPAGAHLIALAGLDGAGKSTHAAALVSTLRARGLRATVVKIYRRGPFLALAGELGARTRRGAPLAAFRVSRLVKLVDSARVLRDQLLPALRDHDAVVLDRYVETHVAAAAAQLGWDLRDHPLLAAFPPADRTVWLRLPPARALARLAARAEPPSADEHYAGLAGYARCHDALQDPARDLLLDGEHPIETVARTLARSFAHLTPRAHVSLRFPSPTRQSLPRARPARHPIDAVLGGPQSPAGADLPRLAAFLRDHLGPRAQTIPAAAWIEALAADILLDVRAATSAPITLPFWLPALRRLPWFSDLHILDEFADLLRPLVRVRRFYAPTHDTTGAAFRLFAPSPAAQRRLLLEYAAALAREAAAEGWPEAIQTEAFPSNAGETNPTTS